MSSTQYLPVAAPGIAGVLNLLWLTYYYREMNPKINGLLMLLFVALPIAESGVMFILYGRAPKNTSNRL